MPLMFLAILALVQGLTELLPISSSAHLILTWEVYGRLDHAVDLGPGQELVLDIAGHVGTLRSVRLVDGRHALVIGARVGRASMAESRVEGATAPGAGDPDDRMILSHRQIFARLIARFVEASEHVRA